MPWSPGDKKRENWEVGDGECIDAVNDWWTQGKFMVDLQATINRNVIQPGAVATDLVAGKDSVAFQTSVWESFRSNWVLFGS